MGANERKILKSLFTDLLKMHDINDVAAAMTVALDESTAKPVKSNKFEQFKEAVKEVKIHISLPELFMMKVSRFDNVYGIWVRRETGDENFYHAQIRENGKLVADIYCNRGKDKCKQMAKGALREYLHKRERKLRRAARKGAK